MHLKFSYVVLYTPMYRVTERKKRFHVQNCPRGTVGANICYVLGLLVHGNVVVEFGRKVLLVDCLLCKALHMAQISLTERANICSCTRKLQVQPFRET